MIPDDRVIGCQFGRETEGCFLSCTIAAEIVPQDEPPPRDSLYGLESGATCVAGCELAFQGRGDVSPYIPPRRSFPHLALGFRGVQYDPRERFRSE